MPIVTGAVVAVVSFVMAIVGVLVLSLVINALAPNFGARRTARTALKVAVSSTPCSWVASALQILPSLGTLAILAGLYGFYLMYLGLPRLMKCPEDKAAGYTVVVVISAIVITVVIGAVGGIAGSIGLVGAGALERTASRRPGAAARPRSAVRREHAARQAAGPRQPARRDQQEDGGRTKER